MPSTEQPNPAFRPDIPRRATDIPGALRPSATSATSPAPARQDSTTAPKTLIVGRDISLNGEITSCDRLVIEGKVEATLNDCQNIEIDENGLFKGAAEVQDADIRGHFDGKLSVRGRLMIRAAGRVSGEVRYGQLEIECGGQLTGTVVSSAADTPHKRPALTDTSK